jgi:hypothetical protein
MDVHLYPHYQGPCPSDETNQPNMMLTTPSQAFGSNCHVLLMSKASNVFPQNSIFEQVLRLFEYGVLWEDVAGLGHEQDVTVGSESL